MTCTSLGAFAVVLCSLRCDWLALLIYVLPPNLPGISTLSHIRAWVPYILSLLIEPVPIPRFNILLITLTPLEELSAFRAFETLVCQQSTTAFCVDMHHSGVWTFMLMSRFHRKQFRQAHSWLIPCLLCRLNMSRHISACFAHTSSTGRYIVSPRPSLHSALRSRFTHSCPQSIFHLWVLHNNVPMSSNRQTF